MKTPIPINKLIRLSCLLALVIGGLQFLFLVLNMPLERALLFSISSVVIIMLVGFINTFLLFVLSKKYAIHSRKFKLYRYVYAYLASSIIYIIFWIQINYYRGAGSFYQDTQGIIIILLGSIVVNTLIIFIQNFAILESDKINAELELSKLKVAHAEAENMLLRQQIHPHFLFNALGTVKVLYRQNQRAGDAYVVHLANFLRASVSNHDNKIAKLEEELMLMQDYLELQKIRFGSALNCTIHIPNESLKKYCLPSFSLQPLLENAIKHNELTEEMPLHVTIHQQGDQIVFCNNLQRKRNRELSTGNGLANLMERYRIWSGDKVVIEENEHLFSVSIKLMPYEYSNNRR